MIITNKALPRRTFLRGVGAAMALPVLDAMVPALAAFSTSTRMISCPFAFPGHPVVMSQST